MSRPAPASGIGRFARHVLLHPLLPSQSLEQMGWCRDRDTMRLEQATAEVKFKLFPSQNGVGTDPPEWTPAAAIHNPTGTLVQRDWSPAMISSRGWHWL